jgi:hypothetical protein
MIVVSVSLIHAYIQGVFKMSAELGYGEGEYYDPTQNHLKKIYAERAKKDQPPNNLIEQRAGGEPFPYWVDDWQHVKNNDQKHKQNSKNRKLAATLAATAGTVQDDAPAAAATQKKRNRPTASAAAAAVTKEDPSAPTVTPTDGRFIFPIGGWMKTAATAKGALQAVVAHSTMLRASPAGSLGKTIRSCFSQMAEIGPNDIPVVHEEPDGDEEEEKEAVPEPPKKAKVVEAPKPVVVAVVQPPPHTNGQSLTLKLRQAKTRFIAEKASENAFFKAFLSGQSEHDPEELLAEFVRYASATVQ